MLSLDVQSFFAIFFSLVGYVQCVAITGISAKVDNVTGERPLRQDINQFRSSGPQWDLYILALHDFQQVDPSDPLSYQQIAGIHGLPSLVWDGVDGSGDTLGYCVHSAVTFPTWHRPYLALFEQALWAHAQRIAQAYPIKQRQAYIDAALGLRIPYWDAFADIALPPVVTEPSIEVQAPEGSRTLDNPLYNYTFLSSENEILFPPDHWGSDFPWTVRHWDASKQQSDYDRAAQEFSQQRQNLRETSWRLFAMETNYTRMASTSSQGGSLEYIHNLVHGVVGGRGHMSDTSTSAFDPIFWLHHANVDRLFAMWQILNPESWIVPSANTAGTFALPPNSIESGSTPLRPFRTSDDASFITSNLARSTRTFGYSYPQLADWRMSQEDLASSIRTEINLRYGDVAKTNVPEEQPEVDVAAKFNIKKISSPATNRKSGLLPHEAPWQWIVTLELQRMAYIASFFVDFFFGIPPVDPSRWATATNLIGSHVHFIPSQPGGTSLPRTSNTLSYGEVPLNPFLVLEINKGTLKNLEPASVIPFLAKALNWRARDVTDHELTLDSLGSLSVAVGSQSIDPRHAVNGFPRFQNLSLYGNITAGKPRGIPH